MVCEMDLFGIANIEEKDFEIYSNVTDENILSSLKRDLEANERCLINVVDLFLYAKMIPSKGEGKRLIKNGGLKIDNETVDNEKLYVYLSEKTTPIKLSVGKKNHKLVNIK